VRGEDWYRSRIMAGHGDWTTAPGTGHQRMPTLAEEDWLPLDALVDVPDPEADTFEQAWRGVLASQMRVALDSLWLRDRHILLRIYEDDWTYEKIGIECNVTRTRIQQIKRDAENRLCDWFNVPRIWMKPKRTKPKS
jgi:DNA-directed RNA polymerase specialized sigma24 family protein